MTNPHKVGVGESMAPHAYALKEITLDKRISKIGDELFLIRDTCNVYILLTKSGNAIAMDFGSGLALDLLEDMGVSKITHVFVSHFHRDQVQGLHRLGETTRVVVPPVEKEMFDNAEVHWARQNPFNDYQLREQRFAPLRSVANVDLASEYRVVEIDGVQVYTLPTPGHTVGSVSYLVSVGPHRYGFTGDLIAAPGKLVSLASLQWNYVGVEGAESAILSVQELANERIDVLLPSHGEPMAQAKEALVQLADNLQEYVDQHEYHPKPELNRRPIREWSASPYSELSPHMLMNTSSHGRSYALLSRSGGAMFFDYGYDLAPGQGIGSGGDRAGRRPTLGSLNALKEQFNVKSVEVVAPTHYHDDHVAGINLLRDVEGTELWCPSRFAHVLAEPGRYDLPCQWYDPILPDKTLPSGATFRWQEYDILVHDLPGHTYYAVAYEVAVDGTRYLITGDQQDGLGSPDSPDDLNYQYKNLFRAGDYELSAELYRQVQPDVLLSGHWNPRAVDEEYIQMLEEQGKSLIDIHNRLLPTFDPRRTLTGFQSRITPYLPRFDADGSSVIEVFVDNAGSTATRARVELVLPTSIVAVPEVETHDIAGDETGIFEFRLQLLSPLLLATPIAADITIGHKRLGQQAEALLFPTFPVTQPQ